VKRITAEHLRLMLACQRVRQTLRRLSLELPPDKASQLSQCADQLTIGLKARTNSTSRKQHQPSSYDIAGGAA
jgi:hypothetical protein